MPIVRDLPLFWKLLLPLLLLTLLWIASAVHTALDSKQSQQLLQDLYTEDVSMVFKLERQVMWLLEFNQLLSSHMTTEDAEAMQQHQLSLAKVEKRLTRNLHEIITSYQTRHPHKAVNTSVWMEDYRIFFNSSLQVIDLSADFEKEQAFVLFNNATLVWFSKLNEHTNQLLEQSAQHMKRSYDQSLEIAEHGYQDTVLFSLLITLFSLFISYLLAHVTSQRLEKMVRWAKSVGEGDLKQRLQTTNRDEIGQLGSCLNDMVEKLEYSREQEHSALVTVEQAREHAVQRARESQVLEQLLRISLNHKSLQTYMQDVLDILLDSVPWLNVLPNAAFFLTENQGEGECLKLQAFRNLSPQLRTLCRQIPFGKCLCGLAAQEQEVQFSSAIDHRHDISFEGMEEHGHFNLPIVVNGKTLGVVVLYLPHGHRREELEITFLRQVADILGMGISRFYNHGSLVQARELSDKANLANLAKDEFLASMSHELRTPLTSIIGNSEILFEQERNTERKELLQAIESAGRSQLALVNDILDMSKIESGKFTIEEQPYDLALLLKDIEQMFSTRIKDAGLNFAIEQQNHETYKLLGDGQRIGQILINLLSNAIKFTEQGSISLVTRLKGDNKLHFTLKDTGIGMSPAVLDRLFQRFEQADNSISRRFGGSGLGLFISINLAEMMGGTIDASSREGIGSIFELILPYRPTQVLVSAEQDTDSAESESVLNEQLSGEILIAEDTLELQLLERRILQSMGLTVTIANNGQEAVELAKKQQFDMILMDMQMPVLDGIGATKTLRAAGNTTPIIALTANVMQKHRDAFGEAGCDGFLAKPIDKQMLRRTLKQHLNRTSPLSPPAEVMPEVDEELVEIFRESNSLRIHQLKQALKNEDWTALREVAHTLKGSAASFGYPQLSTLAEVVQQSVDQRQLEQLPQQGAALISGIEQVL